MEEEYLPKEHLAYIAGFFDGEGCIYITKSKLIRPPHIRYHLNCAVGNTNLLILQYLADCFGGNIGAAKILQKSRKPYWKWLATDNIAYDFLCQIKPYLRIKDREAEEASAFQEFKHGLIHGRCHRSSGELSIMEEAYQILRAMKKERAQKESGK